MPVFTVDVLMPLGNTNQNSKHFPVSNPNSNPRPTVY